MVYRQAMKPEELLADLTLLPEGLLAIRMQLPLKVYQVLIYKYETSYFILQNLELFRTLMDHKGYQRASSETLLAQIEDTLDQNRFVLTDEGWILQDLKTFLLMKKNHKLEIEYFEFEEDLF